MKAFVLTLDVDSLVVSVTETATGSTLTFGFSEFILGHPQYNRTTAHYPADVLDELWDVYHNSVPSTMAAQAIG